MKSPSVDDGEVSLQQLCPNILEAYPRLESIMSCSVCYDTIQDPVLTKCSHSFCSLCIRRYMLYKLQCPSCFSELHENDLIPNKPLREAVQLLSITSSSAPVASTDCNICGIAVLRSKFEAHSLHCANSPVKSLPGSSSSIRMKSISKPVYHLMKDSELKKKLKEEGLSVKGDRKTLISRHQKFVVLWNTERTKDNPLSRSEILTLIQKEEMNETKIKKSGAPSLLSQFDRNSDPTFIELKQKEILNANKASFEELIESVKTQKSRKNSPVRIASQEETPSQGSSLSMSESPSGVRSGDLYITPKRKVQMLAVDSGKKMKQNSVRSLFEQTEKRKVNCPSCNSLITASFLNIHLDRCLEVEGETKRIKPKSRITHDEEDDFIPFSSQNRSDKSNKS